MLHFLYLINAPVSVTARGEGRGNGGDSDGHSPIHQGSDAFLPVMENPDIKFGNKIGYAPWLIQGILKANNAAPVTMLTLFLFCVRMYTVCSYHLPPRYKASH